MAAVTWSRLMIVAPLFVLAAGVLVGLALAGAVPRVFSSGVTIVALLYGLVLLVGEHMTYEVYRRAGIAAPMTAHAHVTINGIDSGIYVMREPVNRDFLTIIERSVSTMIHYLGYNDVVRIYDMTKRDGVDYNLAYIETDFGQKKNELFDPAYMKALFDYAYGKGRNKPDWHKAPPILEMPEMRLDARF